MTAIRPVSISGRCIPFGVACGGSVAVEAGGAMRRSYRIHSTGLAVVRVVLLMVRLLIRVGGTIARHVSSPPGGSAAARI
ncbi:hypothetical protein GCM10023087_33930 [Microbacterium rhizosphaerae]